MTLQHTSTGDTGKLGIVQPIDAAGTTIAHARAQATRELIYHLLHRALIRNAAGDTLGHEFLHVARVALEVSVAATVLLSHGLERAHAKIGRASCRERV